MLNIMVLPQNAEQQRTIEAFLNALKIAYIHTDPSREELEARLKPDQRQLWDNLKQGWQEAKNGNAAAHSLDALLNEIENEDNSVATVR